MPRDSTVMFRRIHDEAIVPKAMSDGAAGFDLYADDHHRIESEGDWNKVSTGIECAIPPGFVGLVWPRSGMAVRQGIDTGAGVIDSDYRGEIKVVLFNHGDEPVGIDPGDRIAQLVVVPCVTVSAEVDALPDTERAADGFGSTGR